MVAIFTTKADAQKYADKCHLALKQNCPGYNALLWQNPVEYKEGWGIKVPQEYYRKSYVKASEIEKETKTDFNKNKEVIEKPESLFIDDLKL